MKMKCPMGDEAAEAKGSKMGAAPSKTVEQLRHRTKFRPKPPSTGKRRSPKAY